MITKPLHMVLIGCGAIGSAMARGWLIADVNIKLTVVTPNRESISDLPNIDQVKWYPAYQTVPLNQNPDVIVLAVKPEILKDVLPTIPYRHLSSAVVISVAAGKNLDFYYNFLPRHTALAKIMPNLPVAFHAGMSVGFSHPHCSPEQNRIIEDLFKTLGKFMWLEEEELFHAATVVSGCGPAYLYMMEESMTKAAESIGFSEKEAQLLVRQTLIGSARMLSYVGASATDLKEKVTSPHGVTAAARTILEKPHKGLTDLFTKAFETALRRSREIVSG